MVVDPGPKIGLFLSSAMLFPPLIGFAANLRWLPSQRGDVRHRILFVGLRRYRAALRRFANFALIREDKWFALTVELSQEALL